MGISSPAVGYEGYISSNTALAAHAAEESTTSSYVVKATFEILTEISPASDLRFKADIESSGAFRIDLLIHLNGVNIYEVWDNTGAYVTKSFDTTMALKRGDIIKFWARSFDSLGKIKNMEICGDLKKVKEA